jgi:rfaE bifunctional protein nucleotidyltransferase chain/domain
MKNAKIKSLDEIIKITKLAKAKGLKVITTGGTFDILHVGHLKNFELAKSYGDILIVGINSDSSVKAYKGNGRPIINDRDRATMVAGFTAVDYVFIFDDPDPRPWLQKIHTDIYVKGDDWKNPNKSRAIRTIVEKPLLKAKGIKLIFVKLIPGKSTTAIIEKIKKL